MKKQWKLIIKYKTIINSGFNRHSRCDPYGRASVLQRIHTIASVTFNSPYDRMGQQLSGPTPGG